MQRLVHVRCLVLVTCLLGLTGCGAIVDRTINLLYPTETPRPPSAEKDPATEPASLARTAETPPKPTLTWPVPSATLSPSTIPSPTASAQPTSVTTVPTPAPTQQAVTPSAEPTFTPLATPTTPMADPTLALPIPASPTVSPQEADLGRLVYLEGSNIWRGDSWGASPEKIATLPALDTQAFRRGLWTVAQGSQVTILDLASGKQVSAKMDVAAGVEYVELMWGAGSRTLVYSALTTEGLKSGKRHIELHVLDVSAAQTTGQLATVGRVILDDVQSVSLLRYDEDQKRLLLVPRGDHPVFMEIRFYDIASGQLVDTYPAEGQSDVLISPDGRYILTEQFTDSGAQFALYDLRAQGEARPQVWAHEKGAYSMFPLWSPDGEKIAYLLLRSQEGGEDPIETLGLWVLDLASGQARRVLDEDSPFSSLIAWTPDSSYIVGYHEADTGSYFYAVRPDGGDRRTLELPPRSQILGWMP